MRSLQRGITLLELSITMALIALLASIATPAITGYVDRARTNRAIGEIGRVSIELYRWRSNNGGVFPDALADANIDMDPDPWGNNYVYSNVAGGGAARTSGGNAVNTDFDLYSTGNDGATAASLAAADSADDVVRANNGAFLGLAGEY
jgi:general secretion pathway protein G